MDSKIVHVNDNEAKALILNHINKKRSFRKLDWNDVKIKNVISTDSIIYYLRTFFVCQKLNEKFTKKTHSLDTSNFEKELQKSIMQSQIDENFFENTIVLPNSETFKVCHDCNGLKRIKCKKCSGTGNILCWYCCGCTHVKDCHNCEFKGYTECESCSEGKIACRTCDGNGIVKWYKEVSIKRYVLQNEFIKCKDTSVPLHILKRAKGETIVKESNNRLVPINHFPDFEVNEKSKELLNVHKKLIEKYGNSCNILSQYQELYAIPVTSGTATYKNKLLTFYVVGEDKKLFVPKTNASCSIL